MNTYIRCRAALGLAAFATIAPLGSSAPQSAGTPVEIARSFRLQSRALGEERVIDVSLPRR